jgi:O-antigen/teichoic acid export membrane protein
MADQKSAVNDSIQFAISASTIVVCLVLKAANLLNFYSLLVAMCTLPVIVLSVYTVIYFSKRYKFLRPSLEFVNHEIRKDLLSLGFKFFLIQIVALTIFSTTNILIAQLFNISDVTLYNIAFKYYNVTVILFAILMSPLWGAFTNAWFQGDVKWIVKNIKFYILISFSFLIMNLLQFVCYPFFIQLWLKQDLSIPLLLTISFILYNFIYCYNNIFSHFLASIGEINKQVYAAVIGGIINIPLTIFLARHTQLGLSAILYANVLCLLPSTFVTTLQTIQLIKRKA